VPSTSQHPFEAIATDLSRPEISHVIFDFDGTLSWLRHGWPQIMLAVFLNSAPTEWRNDPQIARDILGEILSLNGKPSIYQAEQFCARLGASGQSSPQDKWLLDEYQRELRTVTARRIASVQNEPHRCDEFVVCGARAVLENLRDRGATLILLSGTLERDVMAEAELLGLAEFFGRHLYGSPATGAFSKKDVIDRIMREERIEGAHLLAFGDGPMEIQFTKSVGGLAIGVASDEEMNGSHRVDPIKRDLLLCAGADAIIPDYAQADELLATIFKRETP
jgi:phosphoglycolate phosphatase-like HAD superfamily hydrolase